MLLTPVLLLLPFLLPTSAQAVSVDGGALTPGTAATATFAAAGDQVTYTIAVPANQTVTLTAATSTDPVQVSVSATAPAGAAFPHNRAASPTSFGNVTGVPRVLQLLPYPMDETVTITLTATAAGSLPLTPALFADAPVTAITANATTRATLAVAGQFVPFTLPLSAPLMAVRINATALAPSYGTTRPWALSAAVGPNAVSVQPTADPNTFQLRPSSYSPGNPQTLTLKFVGVNGAVGTIDFTAFAVADTTTQLTVGTPLTVTLGTPLATATLNYTPDPMRRARWQISNVNLHHADGSVGSAAVRQKVGFGSFPVTTLSDQPYDHTDDDPAQTSGPMALTITADGATTGTVTVLLTWATEPEPVTLTLGTPATVTVGSAGQNQVFSLPVTAGTTYKLALDVGSIASPSGTSGLNTLVYLRAPGADTWVSFGYTQWSALLNASATATSVSYAATTTGTLTIFVNPAGDLTGRLGVTASVLADVVRPISSGVPVTASAVGGRQRLVFTHAGTAGSAVPGFHLSDIALTKLPGLPDPTGLTAVTVAIEQDGQVVANLGTISEGTASADYPSTLTLPGFDGTKAWQLVITTWYNTTATLTVRLDLPTVTVVPVTSGRPVTVRFAHGYDYSRLTFTTVAGQRPMVRLRANTAQATYQLIDAAGNVVPTVPTQDEWQGFESSSPEGPLTQPLTLVVQSGGGTGSVEVTVLLVTDPTYAFTNGQQRTVSWTTEQNPKLTFSVPDPGFAPGAKVALEVTRTTGTRWTTIQPALAGPYGPLETMPAITAGTTSVSTSTPSLAPGTYTIALDPPTSGSGSLLVRLRVVRDYTGSVQSGQTVTVPVTAPEQVSTVSLTTTSVPRRVTWSVRQATLPLRLEYTNPATGVTTTSTITRANAQGVLPVNPDPYATYSVVVTPIGLTTGSFKLELTAR